MCTQSSILSKYNQKCPSADMWRGLFVWSFCLSLCVSHAWSRIRQEDRLSLPSHLAMAGINCSYLNHYLCVIVNLFPTVPWEELISVSCTSPPCTDHIKPLPTVLWLILPTIIPVRILQWNCSELLCLWQFWSRITYSLEYSAENRNLGELCDRPLWNRRVLRE